MDSSDMISGPKQNNKNKKKYTIESKESPKFLVWARSQDTSDKSQKRNHKILFNGEESYQCFQNTKWFVLSHVKGIVSILQAT